MKKKCIVCNRDDHSSRMIQDEHYKDVWFHLDCINSARGRQWRAERSKEDHLYARYLDLILHGKHLRCPSCGEDCKRFLKSADKPEIWETVCTICGSVNHEALSIFDEKNRSLIEELKDLEKKFLHSINPEIANRVELLAALHGNFGKCECGGEYSIAAKPRCFTCYTELVDSYFHYVEC